MNSFACRIRVLGVSTVLLLAPLAPLYAEDPPAPVTVEKLSERMGAVDQSVESTVFDLYLSDKFRGSLLVSYTDSWFEIDEPSEALEQLPELKKGQDDILPLLTGRIERERSVEGIGKVYYDLSSFRIILELRPEFLKASGLDLSKRVLSPSSGLSFNQSFGVSAVTQDAASTQSALSHRSFGSVGQFFTRIDGTAVQNRPYEVTEATAGGIIGDYQLRGGLLQMKGQSFSPSLQFAGLQLETAEQIFLDDELARGSPLQIFVPSRATVEFYRDGRLLNVMVLDYGLQEVDTSGFPQGSYDVDIIIKENSGHVTQDKRFFTKAGFLASRAHPVFSLSAGLVRDRLDVLSTPLIQGNVRYRALSILDLGTGISATDKNMIGTGDFNGLYRGFRFGAGGAVSDDNASGVQGTLGITALGASLTSRIARTYGTTDTTILVPTPTPTGIPIIPAQAIVRRDLTLAPQEVTSVGLYRNFNKIDARINIERNKVSGAKTRYTNGPTIDWRIMDSVNENLTARASYLATELGTAKSLQLLYRKRLTPVLAVDAQILQRWQPARDETLFLVGLTYDSFRGLAGTGTRIRGSLEAQRQQQDLDTRNGITGSLDADVTSQYVRSVGFARGVRENGETTKTLGINAESSFLVSDKGDISLGHPVQSDAAFIAEVQGDELSKDATFEVLLDGQVREVVRPGERALVGLAPYRTYKASIRPTEGSSIVDYDTSIQEFSLFPGNVVKRVWKVERTFIILGRLVDESGAVIPHERIRGTKEYSFTEEDGTFQAEINGKDQLYVESKRTSCVLDFKLETKPEYFVDIGDIVCRAKTTPPKE